MGLFYIPLLVTISSPIYCEVYLKADPERSATAARTVRVCGTHATSTMLRLQVGISMTTSHTSGYMPCSSLTLAYRDVLRRFRVRKVLGLCSFSAGQRYQYLGSSQRYECTELEMQRYLSKA